MKLLFITRNFKIEGGKRAGESFLSSLLTNILKHREFDISILSIDDEIRKCGEDNPSLNVTRVFSRPKYRRKLQFQGGFWIDEKRLFMEALIQKNKDLAKIVKEVENRFQEVDVVHWFDPFSPLINFLLLHSRLYGVRNYVTHFSFFEHYPLNNFLLKASLFNFDKIITTTASLANLFRVDIGLDSARIKHIPLGVDLDLYRPPLDKGTLKRKKGIGEDQKVISWFGPIENCTFDDFRYLLTSTRKIHRKIPSSLFLFCFKYTIPNGLYPYESYVKFVNDLSSISEILRITDLVVLPGTLKSWRIGLPLTVLEALASGVPVVTAKSQGVNEAVIDGFNGNLTERLEDFPKVIMDLCKQENKLIEMSQNSRIFAEKYFNIENIAKMYLDLWETGK